MQHIDAPAPAARRRPPLRAHATHHTPPTRDWPTDSTKLLRIVLPMRPPMRSDYVPCAFFGVWSPKSQKQLIFFVLRNIHESFLISMQRNA
jgi:hypothetical protein